MQARDEELDRYINLKLAALGLPVSRSAAGSDFLEIAGPLLRNYYQKDRQLGNWLCASDSRIQDFLDGYLGDVCPNGATRLPANTFVLDREGMGRVLSLPVTVIPSRRRIWIRTGCRRACCTIRAATAGPRKGLFHIAEGGFPVPADKAAVPKQAFAALVERGAASARRSDDAAVSRPDRRRRRAASCRCCCARWSARPRATEPAKTMEIRFIAPGSLVSNLDFVESIFGNGGDPYLPENDAGARCAALDRPYGMRRAGAAHRGDAEESARTAALRAWRRSGSGATACAGRTRRSSTTKAAHSRWCAAMRAA